MYSYSMNFKEKRLKREQLLGYSKQEMLRLHIRVHGGGRNQSQRALKVWQDTCYQLIRHKEDRLDCVHGLMGKKCTMNKDGGFSGKMDQGMNKEKLISTIQNPEWQDIHVEVSGLEMCSVESLSIQVPRPGSKEAQKIDLSTYPQSYSVLTEQRQILNSLDSIYSHSGTLCGKTKCRLNTRQKDICHGLDVCVSLNFICEA